MAINKNPLYNESEVRKAIRILKPDNELFEVRIINNNGYAPMSGYFDNADDLLKELNRTNLSNANAYITLQHINDACKGREQFGKIKDRPKATTSDQDIVGYEWLFVDLDPKRPAGTSSTDEQLTKAKVLGNDVYRFLSDNGFEKPVSCLSGNGVHLLYKIHIGNIKERSELIKSVLKVLAMLFDTDEVGIDVKNFNPSRITKLYGTKAQKGRDSEEYPHRFSQILGDYEEVKVTDLKYLEKIANMYPIKADDPQRYNNYDGGSFNLDEWLDKFSFRYRKTVYSDGDKYILDCCPFDSNHKGKDACLFRARNGAIGFHCFHNSCDGKTWRDVRMLKEPNAYEKREKVREQMMYKTFNRHQKPVSEIKEEDGKPIFKTALQVINEPKPVETFIKTGIDEIDRKLRGLKKGGVSLWSGSNASAKSTILSQICLDAVDVGNRVAVFSGELSDSNFFRWMMLQAAGKNHVEPSQFEGYYNVSRQNQEIIANWLEGKLWLFNNDYGNNFQAILKRFEQLIDAEKIDFLVLDNLMAFDLSDISQRELEAQTDFVWSLHSLAERKNVHICFVAHPRKSQDFLRKNDISGSSNLTNAVDYVFIVHRNNTDFQRLSKAMFGWQDDHFVYTGTNVVEICKDRDGGTVDYFIPLWYEIETKRLKNSMTEMKKYGWLNYTKGTTDTEYSNVDDALTGEIEDGFIEYEDEESPFY